MARLLVCTGRRSAIADVYADGQGPVDLVVRGLLV